MTKKLPEHVLKGLYNDFIDETNEPVTIMGMNYDPSRALEELDPIAYRCGYVDWLDSEGYEEE